ncbi:MAG: MFS transporter [Rubrivivax sp.]
MEAVPARPGSRITPRRVLPWAIALATGLEYFDATVFIFYIGQMAAGVHATPAELIGSASAYAVASVLGILSQQWWVERVGFRRYITACLLLFAAAAVAAAFATGPIELALLRGVQGYGMGPMMGVCRILLQVDFTPQDRPQATRIFLLMILVASALAPLLGGDLIAAFGWRSLFVFCALAALALAVLIWRTVPHTGHLEPEARSHAPIWPYIVFALSQGALQVAMQQAQSEHPSRSPGFWLLVALAGVLSLAWFAHHQWHHPRPLVRLQALREQTFRTGLALYVLFYFMSNVLGYLSVRLLEGGLGHSVQGAGRLLGLTALASLPMALVYFRYSARITRRRWLIVSGFALAAVIGLWMAQLPPDAGPALLVPPMVLRGLLLIFIALPAANIAFRVFEADEFHHGYRFKNIVRQLTYSFATTCIVSLEQHRFAAHSAQLRAAAAAAGHAPGPLLAQQASFLSLVDGFYLLIGIAVLGGLYAAWQKRID